MSGFRITDGKGFGIDFANGWAISVQFGYGNYADNYDYRGDFGDDFTERNRKAGAEGSRTAECAVFNNVGEMVKLPAFMFDSVDYSDVVSNRSNSTQVLRLMNWASEQLKVEEKP
jgi:hypothetical protein